MGAGEDLFGKLASVLGRYTDGMLRPPLKMLLVMIAGWINRRQLTVIDYLREENRVLRELYGKRRL
jgi:hypothetical protein